VTSAEPPPSPPALHAAFRDLFREECSYVVHTLRRLGVAPADCADVAHEVFLVVLRRLPGCDRTRPIRPWLFAIAFRVAQDYRRLARVRREVPMELDPPDESLTPEEALRVRRRRQLVAEGLEVLEPGRRAVFVMHDIEGYAMPEIAHALELGLNTAYSRLRLARAEFAAFVKRKGSSHEQ
jgi:RNA polymerase sigma-70 factor (ECF subfamily)